MAAKAYPLLNPVGTNATMYEIDNLNNSPEVNIHSAGAQVFGVDIDATQNTGEHVYVPFYDLAAPTVGTDDPEMCLKGFSGVITSYVFSRGIPFVTALSVACVKEACGSGSTSPGGQVDVVIHAADD